jgi:hypothetical protein
MTVCREYPLDRGNLGYDTVVEEVVRRVSGELDDVRVVEKRVIR